MPGICTSSRTTAKSSCSSAFSASSPEVAETSRHGSGSSTASQREQVLRRGRRRAGRRAVAGHRGASRCRPAARAAARSRRAGDDLRASAAARAAAGIVGRSARRRGPGRSRSRRGGGPRPGPAAPSSLAPVSTTPTDAGAERVGGGLERDVDRRPAEAHLRLGGEREVVALDEHVVAGGATSTPAPRQRLPCPRPRARGAGRGGRAARRAGPRRPRRGAGRRARRGGSPPAGPARIAPTACRPPQEAPMTTSSTVTTAAGRSSRPRRAARSASSIAVPRSVSLRPSASTPRRGRLSSNSSQHAVLQLAAEVDQHVAAEDRGGTR